MIESEAVYGVDLAVYLYLRMPVGKTDTPITFRDT